MIWLILLFLLMCAALVACVFEGAIRAEVYPAEAADVPGLDCGCAIGSVVLGCMVCDRTSCPTHQSHDHAPIVVAGSDMDRLCRPDRAQMALRFRLLVDESLSDLRSVDAALAPLYVVPEVER